MPTFSLLPGGGGASGTFSLLPAPTGGAGGIFYFPASSGPGGSILYGGSGSNANPYGGGGASPYSTGPTLPISGTFLPGGAATDLSALFYDSRLAQIYYLGDKPLLDPSRFDDPTQQPGLPSGIKAGLLLLGAMLLAKNL